MNNEISNNEYSNNSNPDPVSGAREILESLKLNSNEILDQISQDIFYDPKSKDFIAMTPKTKYTRLNTASLNDHIQLNIMSKEPFSKLGKLTPCDSQIRNHIQMNKSIDYSGALSGYQLGPVEQGGKLILVTSEANKFEIRKQDYSVLMQLLINMFGHDKRQLLTFLYWLRGIIFEPEKCRQALVLAGRKGSGKTLLQKLITVVLGGRCGKPYRYLIGKTTFNSDFCGTEHLMIDDESVSTNHLSRETLGNEIKQIVVGDKVSLHAKGRDAITVRPWWVLCISLNDEPEDLQVLPRIDESIEDKLLLFKVEKKPMPMPTRTKEQQKAFWNALVSGMSGLLHVLRDLPIEEDYQDDRYVVAGYHHPEIVQALRDQSKEAALLELIDNTFPRGFKGTATQIDERVRDKFPKQADKVMNFTNACGTLLGRLRKIYPERIVYEHKKANSREWIINPKHDT